MLKMCLRVCVSVCAFVCELLLSPCWVFVIICFGISIEEPVSHSCCIFKAVVVFQGRF